MENHNPQENEKTAKPGGLDGGLYITTDQENKQLVVAELGDDAALRLSQKQAQWLAQMLISESEKPWEEPSVKKGTEIALDEKIFYREIEKKDTLDKAIIAVEELIVRYSSFMVKVLNRAAQTDDQTAAELVDQGMRGINHLSIALSRLNDLLED